MLKTPAPFPQVGSFALLIDRNLPAEQQRAELVRVEYRRNAVFGDGIECSISFPLRTGASGNRVVAESELIDATPLSADETAELERLRALLPTQVRPARAKIERAEKLRTRQVYSDVIKRELATLARREAREQPSAGRLIPREAAA